MNPLHNLGLLRKAAEDTLVAYLKLHIPQAEVRAAMSGAKVQEPVVVVHAQSTSEMDDTTYRLSRNMTISVRVRTHGFDEAESAQPDIVVAARDAHFSLVNQTCRALVQSDIVTLLDAIGNEYVGFSTLFMTGDEGGVEGSSYMSMLAFDALAFPKEV